MISVDTQDGRAETQRSTRVQRLFRIHGWSGVGLGLLLYAVILTGTIAVFAEEIGHWSSPLPVHPEDVLQPGLDRALRSVAETVDPQFYDEVGIRAGTGERLSAFFHGHVHTEGGGIVEEGVEIEYDPSTWQILDRREGEASDIRAGDNDAALARFLIDLHVRLYLPDPWGLLLTGILGLAMMVAAVTGLIVHRKLIKNLFVQRISARNALLTARDRHVVAGSWNLVFAFLLAFTGCFFSFAGSFGLPMMAMVASGGDQEKLIETVVALPEAHDASPAELADLDMILADARTRATDSTSRPVSLNVMRWGRADAVVMVNMSPSYGTLSGTTLVYDGATGTFVRDKPNIGQQPSLGNDVLGLIGPLHFGNFGGVASKAVWFGLGCASAYVVVTGLLLWTHRRRALGWLPMEKATVWMGYGLPLALVVCALGFFAATWLPFDPSTAVKGTFLAAVAGVSLLAWRVADLDMLRSRLLLGIAVALLAIVPMRLLGGGPSWIDALGGGWTAVPAMDVLLVIAGVTALMRWFVGGHSGWQVELVISKHRPEPE